LSSPFIPEQKDEKPAGIKLIYPICCLDMLKLMEDISAVWI